MARTSRTTRSRGSRAATRGAGAGVPVLVDVAQRMVSQIEGLVAEIDSLRSANQALHVEIDDAVSMLERASDALAGAPIRGRRVRRGVSPAPRRSRARVSPEMVTPELVGSVIGNLGGEASAAEIAAEITRSGTPVSGRSVRFLAERAGAQSVVGEGGVRRYRLG